MNTRALRDKRKRYWDDTYFQYWKARVKEAGAGVSAVVQGDSRTEDDSVYDSIFSQQPFCSGTLLDIGCAWGRMFPLYKKKGLSISGVDISTAMIESAKNTWEDDDCVDTLAEATAEALPFADDCFDNVVCIATFDATYQDRALTEMFRVAKPGSRLYLTGKHTRYFTDDRLALAAETGAREKGHPNFFTDVAGLIDTVQARGSRVLAGYYFPRRGDFSRPHYQTQMPERFYEYLLVIERGPAAVTFPVISSEHSEAFLQRNREASDP